MNFLNPFILYGLAAAALPLIIHLLTRRRAKDVPFPSIELLERMKTTRMRRLRLKQLLLILLRTLIIVMIVLAFARPAVHGYFHGGARTSAVVIIDASASMRYVNNGEMLFETACRSARDIIDMLSGNDFAGIVIAGHEPKTLGQGLTADFTLLSKELADAEAEWSEADVTGAYRAALSMLDSSSDPNREVYFITDGAENTLPDSLPELSAPCRMYTIIVGPQDRDGAFMESLSLQSPLAVTGRPVDFVASTSFGATTAEADIEFFVDDERKGKTTVVRGQTNHTQTPFAYIPETAGLYSVRASVDDGRFEPGETCRLVLRIPEQINVLLAGDTGDDVYFLEKALNPDSDRVMFRIAKRTGDSLRSDDIRAADVIVFSGVKSLSSDVYSALITSVVDHGAGLIVFPSRSLDEKLYANGLFRDLFPAIVENRIDYGANGVSSAAIDKFDIAHPVLFGVSKEGDFQKPAVTSYVRLRPTGNHNVLARFGDGSPAIADAVCGKGRVMVYSFSVGDRQTDFPLTGVFIPLLVRSAQYLAGSDILGPRFVCGETVTLTLGDIPADAQVAVKHEDAPARSVETVHGDGGVRLDNIEAGPPGFYSVIVDGVERIRYAVDTPLPEVLFVRAGRQSVEAAYKRVLWKQFEVSANPAAQIMRDRYGRELFGYFLTIALILLAVEMAVARKV